MVLDHTVHIHVYCNNWSKIIYFSFKESGYNYFLTFVFNFLSFVSLCVFYSLFLSPSLPLFLLPSPLLPLFSSSLFFLSPPPPLFTSLPPSLPLSYSQQVVDCGALDALVICLEEFDPGVKESAAWALGYIARHNAGKRVQLL